MRLVLSFACAFLLTLSVPVAGRGQVGEPGADVSLKAPAASSDAATQGYPADAATQTSSGLPQRAAPARTLRAHWHVYVAFAITWLLLFGYALSLGRRFGRLDEEVRRLSRTSH